MAEDCKQELVCFLYISPNSSSPGNSESTQKLFQRDVLEKVIKSLKPSGPWQITETGCGLVAAFSSDNDAEKLMCIDLASALGGPVEVVRFSASDARYRQAILLQDVPWTIPLQDITKSLAIQGIATSGIQRIRQHVRVEVLDAIQYESLLQHGLNFFGAVRFTAIPEQVIGNGSTGNSSPRCLRVSIKQNSILQCYRCQGFWHVAANCRHLLRCVRCGQPHNLESCPRPRDDPVCCHCGGPHHAAYRKCPVRLQLLNATPVSNTLSSNNPNSYKLAPDNKQLM